jgi:hypothetical protein
VPFVLRSGRRSRWYPDAIIQETLKDLQPDINNKLSVWLIEDDRSNLMRVICALATWREEIENVDYILTDYQVIVTLNISIEHTLGASADEEANERWHRNLCDLTEQKRLDLAQAIKQKCESVRIPQKDIAVLLADGIIAGRVNRGKMRLKSPALVRLDRVIKARQALI